MRTRRLLFHFIGCKRPDLIHFFLVGLGVLATFIPMDGLHFYKIAAVEMGYRLPQAPTPKHAVLPWLANKSLPDRVTVDPRRVLDRIFFRHSDRVDVVGKAMIIAFPVQSL